jgi:hypothetical protein
VLAEASTLCGSATTCSSNNQILVPIYTSGTNSGSGSGTTTTSAPSSQTYTVNTGVSTACYNNPNSSSCGSVYSALPTTPGPVTINGVTYTCTSGPVLPPAKGPSSPRTLIFTYSGCTTQTSSGGGRVASSYVIKYIAAFVWTARTNTTITGYFTTMNLPPAGTNSWSNLPGPITSAVLVR